MTSNSHASQGAPLDAAAAAHGRDEGSPTHEQRSAPRFTLLIRAAKLIAGEGEFLVVVRDVSRDGVKIKTFHPLPPTEEYAIELSSGERHAIEKVWDDGSEKGFRFSDPVALEQLLAESPEGKRKRPVRLRLEVGVGVSAGGRSSAGLLADISQHGACIVSDDHLAIGERVRIQGESLPELTGRVRWRRRPLYGLILEQTFRFEELARLTAQLSGLGASPTAAPVGSGRVAAKRAKV
jgi:hypothetical protein